MLTFGELIASTGAQVQVKSPTGVNGALGELDFEHGSAGFRASRRLAGAQTAVREVSREVAGAEGARMRGTV
ncbi:hypothetical protein GCM10009741_12710 [Kribbella lupini]|uniref:Uncharacterized protein n=1 Tax=Kribbella lupini TaxID=291602 RepID=A0ABN2AC26_9ACTN